MKIEDTLRAALERIAFFPSGGIIHPGTSEADRDEMIHIARGALAGDRPFSRYIRQFPEKSR